MKISSDILDILSRSKIDDNCLSLPGQLDRNLYVRVDKVLKDAGAKWNKKANGHVFQGSASDRIESMLLTGEISSAKDFGFIPTALPYAEMAVEKLCVEDGMTLLEPSAGHGDLIKPVIGKAIIDCIELRDENMDILRTIQGVREIIHGDFLTMKPTTLYDRILMNPPFLRLDYIRHILHAFEWLKPGGCMVAIAPVGFTFGSTKLDCAFRDFLEENDSEVTELPVDAFKASGVRVNTVMIVVRKSA